MIGILNPPSTLLKINIMEHNNERLVQMLFLVHWVIFRFHVSFSGGYWVDELSPCGKYWDVIGPIEENIENHASLTCNNPTPKP